MTESVFKMQIKTSMVRIYHKKWFPFQASHIVMSPNGNIYYPEGHNLYSHDISTHNINAKALFIHEMTHVYQWQKFINVKKEFFKARLDYDYLPIDKNTNFNFLNIEEQAELVKDYYLLKQKVHIKNLPPLKVYEAVIPWLP